LRQLGETKKKGLPEQALLFIHKSAIATD
jgi:hypothetical protein